MSVVVGQLVEFPRTGLKVVVQEKIGDGSFGTVHRAVSPDGARHVFALKESVSENRHSLAQVESEINVLFSLDNLGLRVPAVADYTIVGTSDGRFRSRILMSLEPGVPLNKYLSENVGKLSWEGRVELASALMAQLTPTLRILDSVCVHRDVTSGNILIDTDGCVKFTLIDFGLAIDRNAWWHYRWRDAAIGGDCRYWPACAWSMLIHGWKGSSFATDQYRDKLDMHSFALVVLEVICGGEKFGLIDGPVEAIAVQSAWREYMQSGKAFWSVFYECFRNQGDWKACKEKLEKDLQVEAVTRQGLGRIKAGLKKIRNLHPLFHLIEKMMCIDDSTVTASWGYVADKLVLMDRARDSRPVTPVVPNPAKQFEVTIRPRQQAAKKTNDAADPVRTLRSHY